MAGNERWEERWGHSLTRSFLRTIINRPINQLALSPCSCKPANSNKKENRRTAQYLAVLLAFISWQLHHMWLTMKTQHEQRERDIIIGIEVFLAQCSVAVRLNGFVERSECCIIWLSVVLRDKMTSRSSVPWNTEFHWTAVNNWLPMCNRLHLHYTGNNSTLKTRDFRVCDGIPETWSTLP